MKTLSANVLFPFDELCFRVEICMRQLGADLVSKVEFPYFSLFMLKLLCLWNVLSNISWIFVQFKSWGWLLWNEPVWSLLLFGKVSRSTIFVHDLSSRRLLRVFFVLIIVSEILLDSIALERFIFFHRLTDQTSIFLLSLIYSRLPGRLSYIHFNHNSFVFFFLRKLFLWSRVSLSFI